MMRRFLFLLLAVLLTCTAVAGPVWEVRRGDRVMYVGGTCHILRESDYPLPQVFYDTFEQADLLVFEADPRELRRPATQMQLLARGPYTDGRSLETVLTAETYAALEAACSKRGMTLARMKTLRPALLVVNLMVLEMRRHGIPLSGVEDHLVQRATPVGKPIEGLESIAEHIDIIVSLGEGEEDAFVRHSLLELDELDDILGELIAAWRRGDGAEIQELMNDPMKEQFPKLYKAILVDRNTAWVPKLEAYLETPDREFILVGVAHLVGPDGLLATLEAKGCTLRRLGQD